MPDTKCGFDNIPGGATGAALLTFYGPTILVNIGFDANYQATNPVIPTAGITGIRALIDTGAGESCIDQHARISIEPSDCGPATHFRCSWKSGGEYASGASTFSRTEFYCLWGLCRCAISLPAGNFIGLL